MKGKDKAQTFNRQTPNDQDKEQRKLRNPKVAYVRVLKFKECP